MMEFHVVAAAANTDQAEKSKKMNQNMAIHTSREFHDMYDDVGECLTD